MLWAIGLRKITREILQPLSLQILLLAVYCNQQSLFHQCDVAIFILLLMLPWAITGEEQLRVGVVSDETTPKFPFLLTVAAQICFGAHWQKPFFFAMSDTGLRNSRRRFQRAPGAPFALSCGTCRAWGAPAADVKALCFTDLIKEIAKYLNRQPFPRHMTPFLICLCSSARALSPDPRW